VRVGDVVDVRLGEGRLLTRVESTHGDDG
jgi:hypothetical protein